MFSHSASYYSQAPGLHCFFFVFFYNLHMWTLAILFKFACNTPFIICLIEKSLLVLSAWLDLSGFDSALDFTQSGSGECALGRGCTCVTVHISPRSVKVGGEGCVYVAFVWLNHITDFHSGTLRHSSSYNSSCWNLVTKTGFSNSLTHHVITCQTIMF